MAKQRWNKSVDPIEAHPFVPFEMQGPSYLPAIIQMALLTIASISLQTRLLFDSRNIIKVLQSASGLQLQVYNNDLVL